MKKSQLRKIIRESIKELMTEVGPESTPQSSGPDKYYRLVRCDGGGTFPLFCHKSSNPPLQIGDTLQMGPGGMPAGTNWFVSSGPLFSGCTHQQGWGEPDSYKLVPCTTCCGGCNPCATTSNGSCNCWSPNQINSWAQNWQNNTTPQGACWNACSSTSAGSCNPSAWSNHTNWTSTFTNTVNNFPASNTNQPCNFLNQKIAQFTANLQGTGQGNYQNMLNCKLDLANQLHASNNC